jgi:predicted 3-demethylubiquinone-9 3-methyltransferase (glyoxalase superfamily)
MKKMSVCLWFDRQAEESAKFYSSVFKNARIHNVTKLIVDFTLENADILGLNGGPLFKFTPANSFFVRCAGEAEIQEKWKALSAGGQTRMGLDKYPWAEKYGWTTDRYGVEWQLILQPVTAKIAPAFLFVDALYGRGREALDFYVSVFPDSKIETLAMDDANKAVLHASFKLNGGDFVLSEGPGQHGYAFNEAFSVMVHCADQAEIDRYWNKLIAGGGAPSRCGWLKDKYGVRWQIVPASMREIMKDPLRAERAMAAVMKMDKLDKAAIEAAAR